MLNPKSPIPRIFRFIPQGRRQPRADINKPFRLAEWVRESLTSALSANSALNSHSLILLCALCVNKTPQKMEPILQFKKDMLWKIDQMLECLVYGADDYLGGCKDLYFDDTEWIVRYLVVEISESIENQRVLISPLSISKIDQKRNEIFVSLFLQKIIDSPEAQVDLPISRQYEIALRRYYEWPIYWGENSDMDTTFIKGMDEPVVPLDDIGRSIEERIDTPVSDDMLSDTTEEGIPPELDDEELIEAEFGKTEEEVQYSSQLRSALDLRGYRIQTTTADNSTLQDLLIDDSDWSIRYLVVNLHNSHEKEQILLTLNWIEQIDWGSSRIFVSLSQNQLQNAPKMSPSQVVDIEFEKKVYEYYDGLD